MAEQYQGIRSFLKQFVPYPFLKLHQRWWQQNKQRHEEYITREFHKIYYPELIHEAFWLGVPALKCPLDCWIYQEIIFRTRPEVIIETGVCFGGSTLFLASILNLIGKGEVIGIDIDLSKIDPRVHENSRIRLLEGSSIDQEIIKQVKEISAGKTTMVILDSDHNYSHVLRELNFYSDLVNSGCYMICEDTNLNGNPVYSQVPYNPGPHEAVKEFLKNNSNKWEIDRNCEKLLMTCNPGGYLIKK